VFTNENGAHFVDKTFNNFILVKVCDLVAAGKDAGRDRLRVGF
jgi:hypothetical protein